MTITRAQLYAAGEPLGDCATFEKVGGGRIMGFGGDSSSSTTNEQTQVTNNYDQRQAIDNRVANTDSNNTLTQTDNSVRTQSNTTTTTNTNSGNTTITMLDGGAIAAGRDVSIAALNQNAISTDHVLNLAEILYTKTQQSLNANVELAGQLSTKASNAYADATAQASGNKNLTLVGIAVVGIAAVALFYKK